MPGTEQLWLLPLVTIEGFSSTLFREVGIALAQCQLHLSY
jgi:hypothetical protein